MAGLAGSRPPEKKVTLKYEDIKVRRDKAICVRLAGAEYIEDVWFPTAGVTVDEKAKTLEVGEKLAAEKTEAAKVKKDRPDFDKEAFKAERKAWREESVPLGPVVWGEEAEKKSFGYDARLQMDGEEGTVRVFVHKGQVHDNAAPRWIVYANLAEALKKKDLLDYVLENAASIVCTGLVDGELPLGELKNFQPRA